METFILPKRRPTPSPPGFAISFSSEGTFTHKPLGGTALQSERCYVPYHETIHKSAACRCLVSRTVNACAILVVELLAEFTASIHVRRKCRTKPRNNTILHVIAS